MIRLVLTEEQSHLLFQATEAVAVCASDGSLIGYFHPTGFSADEIAAAKRALASGEETYSTQEVLRHLASLES